MSQIGQERERVKLEFRVNKEAMRSPPITDVLPALNRSILPCSDHLKKAQEPKRVVPMHSNSIDKLILKTKVALVNDQSGHVSSDLRCHPKRFAHKSDRNVWSTSATAT